MANQHADKMNQVIEQWQEANGVNFFEGQSGVSKFTKLVGDMGYAESYQDSLKCFLADNPGLLEVMVEWIADNACPDWIDTLQADLPPLVDEDNDAGEFGDE